MTFQGINKDITPSQNKWIDEYERFTGFDLMFEVDDDGNKRDFLEVARLNVEWYETHTKYVLENIRCIPGMGKK